MKEIPVHTQKRLRGSKNGIGKRAPFRDGNQSAQVGCKKGGKKKKKKAKGSLLSGWFKGKGVGELCAEAASEVDSGPNCEGRGGKKELRRIEKGEQLQFARHLFRGKSKAEKGWGGASSIKDCRPRSQILNPWGVDFWNKGFTSFLPFEQGGKRKWKEKG